MQPPHRRRRRRARKRHGRRRPPIAAVLGRWRGRRPQMSGGGGRPGGGGGGGGSERHGSPSSPAERATGHRRASSSATASRSRPRGRRRRRYVARGEPGDGRHAPETAELGEQRESQRRRAANRRHPAAAVAAAEGRRRRWAGVAAAALVGDAEASTTPLALAGACAPEAGAGEGGRAERRRARPGVEDLAQGQPPEPAPPRDVSQCLRRRDVARAHYRRRVAAAHEMRHALRVEEGESRRAGAARVRAVRARGAAGRARRRISSTCRYVRYVRLFEYGMSGQIRFIKYKKKPCSTAVRHDRSGDVGAHCGRRQLRLRPRLVPQHAKVEGVHVGHQRPRRRGIARSAAPVAARQCAPSSNDRSMVEHVRLRLGDVDEDERVGEQGRPLDGRAARASEMGSAAPAKHDVFTDAAAVATEVAAARVEADLRRLIQASARGREPADTSAPRRVRSMVRRSDRTRRYVNDVPWQPPPPLLCQMRWPKCIDDPPPAAGPQLSPESKRVAGTMVRVPTSDDVVLTPHGTLTGTSTVSDTVRYE